MHTFRLAFRACICPAVFDPCSFKKNFTYAYTLHSQIHLPNLYMLLRLCTQIRSPSGAREASPLRSSLHLSYWGRTPISMVRKNFWKFEELVRFFACVYAWGVCVYVDVCIEVSASFLFYADKRLLQYLSGTCGPVWRVVDSIMLQFVFDWGMFPYLSHTFADAKDVCFVRVLGHKLCFWITKNLRIWAF